MAPRDLVSLPLLPRTPVLTLPASFVLNDLFKAQSPNTVTLAAGASTRNWGQGEQNLVPNTQRNESVRPHQGLYTNAHSHQICHKQRRNGPASVGRCADTPRHTPTTECYLATRRRERLLMHTMTRTNPEIIIWKKSHTKKSISHMTILTRKL